MNPLFKHASRAVKDALRREFRQSNAGQLLTQLENSTLRRGMAANYMRQAAAKMRGMGAGPQLQRMAERFARSSAGQKIEQYAKGQWEQVVFDQVFAGLGPLGDILKAFLRPKGKALTSSIDKELETAAQLLKGFGFEVIPPPNRRAGMAGKAAAAQKFLEQLGFKVTPPGKPKARIVPKDSPKTTGKPRKTLELDIGRGRQRIRLNDPLLTGEMIPVQSSNVHSIGFVIDTKAPDIGTLKIRFLQKSRSGKGPGPLYEYYGVPTDLFRRFRRASSKGKFVWNNIRIRGTVSGHRYDYRLAGISRGYVPRRATVIGREEWYVKRRFVTSGGKVHISGNDMRARTFRAEPNRGRPEGPNRGRPRGPNRGR